MQDPHQPRNVRRFDHPGSGRRKARRTPKGRQVAPEALATVQKVLADRPRRRDLLIEHLHLLQDHFGHLSVAHLAALAAEMRLSQTEVYEVATFYAHFDVVKEDETPPPPLTIRVCDSLSCALSGAEELLTTLTAAADPGSTRIVRAPCMGRCHQAPVCEVGHRHLTEATADAALALVRAGDTHPIPPDYRAFDAYRGDGGYQALGACFAGEKSRDQVIADISAAGLRGLGGAGFPTGRKWDLVRATEGPRLMAVNGDEGEPGTFKDGYYLDTDPHRFLEGMLIAAWVVDASDVYIYLRDEYPQARQTLTTEIAAIAQAGLADHVEIHLRRGAGAYICGEESAMIESLEGKRGLPRHRPPYVAQVGLFGRPTLVNNIETLWWVPGILTEGPGWFRSAGGQAPDGSAQEGSDKKGPGFRTYSVSGRVRNPGVKLAPAGVTVQQLIDDYCGGMAPGHRFKAYLPGGASGGILPARLNDLPLDFGTLEPHGSFVGSHAVVILSDQDDMKAAALNLMRFFRDESCGQCTPCRVGTEKCSTLMQAPDWDQAMLRDLGEAMADASICGLGQAAANPLFSVMKYFPEDL